MAACKSPSYLEQCISALPPEKQEAARRAFDEISETGDDSYLSKLLAVLEANGAYAKQIPQELAEAGEKLVGGMDQVASQLTELDNRRDTWYQRTIASEFQRLGAALPLVKLDASIDRQNQILEQVRRVAARKDEDRLGLIVSVLTIGFLVGIGSTIWFFWNGYHLTQQEKAFCASLGEAGIRLRVDATDTGSRLVVAGPTLGTVAPFSDAHGAAAGVVIPFGKPQ